MPIPVVNAPNSYKKLSALKTYIMDCIDDNITIKLPVFNGASENTIYDVDTDNFNFRALHDYIHIMYNLDFTESSELKVCDIHMDMLKDLNASKSTLRLLEIDVKEQVKYYYKTGKYVQNQRQFVESKLKAIAWKRVN